MSTASSVFLATIPSPDRGVWEIGPFSLRAYALCIILGIVVAIWLGERRWQARGGTKGTIIDIAVWAAPMGLIGGRLYHVITDNQLYFGEGRDPIRALYIWEGGLGIWGAIALGAVGAWIACRRRGIPLPAVADAVAPGIVIAQAVGRLGNYFNQELYGGPTDLPWGLEIYRRVSPDNPAVEDPLGGVALNDVPVEVVHPTFLYELLWNLGVALLIIWLDRRLRLGHGRVFALYVAGYTAGRFWIELMRTDPANEIFGQRVNVWVSAVVFLGAVAYFVLARAKGPREDPETLRSPDDPDNPDEGDAPESGSGGATTSADAEPAAGGPGTQPGSAPSDVDTDDGGPATETAARPEATAEPASGAGDTGVGESSDKPGNAT
ncbi:prolipoprotein diacylglyceryl transferase [Prauserella isguenensis]|uniref:Phosphatidylglycerol--prolipoprotein diacylglyceryl transferase n=1 Tax=Prauserella isguenensis TaxID=1470180 RepID=A0A839S3S6_9PSEU|nr:prolipoprotein diacylglyceryl transferase [Prauserella isguenensis]